MFMEKGEHCALYDFSAQCIFQRKIFSEFNFDTDKTTWNILKDLNPADDDSLPTLEYKCETIKRIRGKMIQFYNLIENHVKKRLEVYQRKIKKKIRDAKPAEIESLQLKFDRVKELNAHYVLGIQIDTLEILETLLEQMRAIDEIIQTKYKEIFATRLKEARLKKGLSRQELGEMLNISQAAVGLYENCKREPPLLSLVKLSKILGVSIDWLTGADLTL